MPGYENSLMKYIVHSHGQCSRYGLLLHLAIGK